MSNDRPKPANDHMPAELIRDLKKQNENLNPTPTKPVEKPTSPNENKDGKK